MDTKAEKIAIDYSRVMRSLRHHTRSLEELKKRFDIGEDVGEAFQEELDQMKEAFLLEDD